MTVHELIDKLTKNCPPNCIDPVIVSDSLTGETGPIVNVRYRHNGRNMILELVTEGDLGVRKAS